MSNASVRRSKGYYIISAGVIVSKVFCGYQMFAGNNLKLLNRNVRICHKLLEKKAKIKYCAFIIILMGVMQIRGHTFKLFI